MCSLFAGLSVDRASSNPQVLCFAVSAYLGKTFLFLGIPAARVNSLSTYYNILSFHRIDRQISRSLGRSQSRSNPQVDRIDVQSSRSLGRSLIFQSAGLRVDRIHLPNSLLVARAGEVNDKECWSWSPWRTNASFHSCTSPVALADRSWRLNCDMRK